MHQMLIFTLTPISPISRRRIRLGAGHALGNDRFRLEMERLTGIRQRAAKRGRKPKQGPGSAEANHEILL